VQARRCSGVPTAKADVAETSVSPRPMAAATRREVTKVTKDETAFALMAIFP
jgi:hypothetical protein